MYIKKTKLEQKLSVLAFVLFIIACSPEPITPSADQLIGSLPETVLDPPDNPRTPEKIKLGKLLFWDPILSGDKKIACVTCHHPNDGYAEKLDLSIGFGGHGLSANRSGGTLVKRNAPTILNTAFNGINVRGSYDPLKTVMFWDNRSNSLEDQSLGPIKSMEEMRGNVYPEEEAVDVVSNRLKAIPEYVKLFNEAFGQGTEINGDKIAKAIAAFERTLIANNSRFDQYARGDKSAMSIEEIRGMNEFIRAKCTACHSGPMFSDFELHDLGVPHNPKLKDRDTGIDGKFRTPTLRNLSSTGPYFHNGSFETLSDAVGFYNRISRNDDDAKQLDFDGNKVDAIVAFLKTLNDDTFDKSIPESVPSGLPVGGDIH